MQQIVNGNFEISVRSWVYLEFLVDSRFEECREGIFGRRV